MECRRAQSKGDETGEMGSADAATNAIEVFGLQKKYAGSSLLRYFTSLTCSCLITEGIRLLVKGRHDNMHVHFHSTSSFSYCPSG